MTTPTRPESKPRIPLRTLLTAVSDPTRWRIFENLQRHGGTPAAVLAERLEVPVSNISKHLSVLLKAGMLERGLGRLYRIPDAFQVPGERTLDFGAVTLRLDQGKL